MYDKDCCKNSCLLDFSPRQLVEIEKNFKEKNETLQKQKLLDELHQHCVCSVSASGDMNYKFIVFGRSVCEEAYLLLYDANKRRLGEVKALFRKGVKSVTHGNKAKSFTTQKTSVALGWLQFNLTKIGEFMPMNNKVYLPVTESRKKMYEDMVKDLLKRGAKETDIISYGYFLQLWKAHYNNYIVGKPSSFTQCSTCTKLTEDRQGTKNEAEVKDIDNLAQVHKEQYKGERLHYHTRREAAQQRPEEWLVIAIDGMDQSKTDIPHFAPESKDTSGLQRLKTHLTGALVYTDCPEGKEAYVFVDVTQFPSDCNLTLTILMDLLQRYADKPARKLHLQMDNCYRENKNRYVLSMAWLLVHYGVYDEVHICFLPVGHTHEDVDQMFSRIASNIRHKNIYTLEGLKQVIQDSYTPTIEVINIRRVMDYREWLLVGMERYWGNHSQPHQFMFKRIAGSSKMFYRKWADHPWRPNAAGHDLELIGEDMEFIFTDGLICMKDIPDVYSTIPLYVKPALKKWNVADLEAQMPKYFAGRLPGEYTAWWNDFFRRTKYYLKKGKDADSRSEEFVLKQLCERPRYTPTPVVPSAQRELIRKRVMDDCPDVIVGKRAKKQMVKAVPDKNVQDEEPKEMVGAAFTEPEDEVLEGVPYRYEGGEVAIGEMVFVNLEEYEDFPQIGEVIGRKEENLTLRWYGKWNVASRGRLRGNQVWKPALKVKGKGFTPWLEEITKDDIIYMGLKKEAQEDVLYVTPGIAQLFEAFRSPCAEEEDI